MADFDHWDELGPPEAQPIPRRHTPYGVAIAVSAVVLAGVALVGLGVWLSLSATRAQEPAGPSAGKEPGTVTESFIVTGPSGSQSSLVVTSTEGRPAPTASAPATAARRRLAFRLDGAVWVTTESGGDPKKIGASASGPFVLSPDGRTLALVDSASHTLALADVGSGRVTSVGPADVARPAWSPSSDWLAYSVTSGSSKQLMRVGRDGKGGKAIGQGDRPAIGPDGTYAYVSAVGRIMVARRGQTPHALSVSGQVGSLAVLRDGVAYSLGGPGGPSDLSLHVVGFDGTGDRQLVGSSAEAKADRYDNLMPSPNGQSLAYCAGGDDGFSRLRCIRLDGSGDSQLSGRRDGYPVAWSDDAAKVYFIDGNALQGQDTALYSILPDGTGRTLVVAKAGT